MQINRIQATPQNRPVQPNFKQHVFVKGNSHIMEKLSGQFRDMQNYGLRYGYEVTTSSHSTPENTLLGYFIDDKHDLARNATTEYFEAVKALYRRSLAEISVKPNSTKKEYLEDLTRQINKMEGNEYKPSCSTFVG